MSTSRYLSASMLLRWALQQINNGFNKISVLPHYIVLTGHVSSHYRCLHNFVLSSQRKKSCVWQKNTFALDSTTNCGSFAPHSYLLTMPSCHNSSSSFWAGRVRWGVILVLKLIWLSQSNHHISSLQASFEKHSRDTVSACQSSWIS